MPKEEIVNRFNEKFVQVELRALSTLDSINRARTKEEKKILYEEVKPLFCIIQDFNNLEKIEFYNWFLHHYECDNDNDNDNGFKIFNIENIKADMQSALEEVARYDSFIKCPDVPYYMIVDKPINNLYFTLCYYLDSQDYIKTDYEEEFVIEFLNLFIGCRELLMIDSCKGEEVIQNKKVYSSFSELEIKRKKDADKVEFKRFVVLMLMMWLLIIILIGGVGLFFVINSK